MDKKIMSMDTSDLAMQHVEEVDSSVTLSQLEMDAVGVLMEFTPSVQRQDHAVLQWCGKRKRSRRLSNSEPTMPAEGEAFNRAFEYAFDGRKFFVARKHALVDTERDLNARAKSPNSPLPTLQMECGAFELGTWAKLGAPQKVHRVAVEANMKLCRPASPSNAEESKMQTSNMDLENAKSRDVVELNPSMQQMSEARLQAGTQAISKPNEFLFKGGGDAYRLLMVPEVKESEKPIIMRNQVLCKQLLKLAMRLAWEIKSLRHKKSMLMEEVHLLKNQNYCLKQQHPSTEAIQRTDVSKLQAASSLLLAGDHCAVLQNHTVMQEGDGGAGVFTVSIAGNSKYNSNASVSTTPSISISSTSQNSTDCTVKDPKYISRTSPQKDLNIIEAQTEPNTVEQNVGPTSGDASMQSTGTKNTGFTLALHQAGRHAALSSSNKHGFIDAHGTWVIAPESLDDCVDDVHVHDTHTHKGGALAQAKTPNLVVDETSSQLTAPHHYLNNCLSGVPAQLIASPQNLNRCVNDEPSHPKAPPQSLNHCVDGISIQRTHSLQSANHRIGNGSIQFPCPLQILNNGAVAQLAWPSSPYEGSPQAIIFLYDRKSTFTEARRRRKEINQLKRQQSKGSKLH